jgi:hypothetical protein
MGIEYIDRGHQTFRIIALQAQRTAACDFRVKTLPRRPMPANAGSFRLSPSRRPVWQARGTLAQSSHRFAVARLTVCCCM